MRPQRGAPTDGRPEATPAGLAAWGGGNEPMTCVHARAPVAGVGIAGVGISEQTEPRSLERGTPTPSIHGGPPSHPQGKTEYVATYKGADDFTFAQTEAPLKPVRLRCSAPLSAPAQPACVLTQHARAASRSRR